MNWMPSNSDVGRSSPNMNASLYVRPSQVAAAVLLQALEEHSATLYEVREGFAAIDDLIAEFF
ncbi:Uncharacterised protein [Serratia liquefaciens]|nr:Uncharacterised protein [Serratia liquefaciens]